MRYKKGKGIVKERLSYPKETPEKYSSKNYVPNTVDPITGRKERNLDKQNFSGPATRVEWRAKTKKILPTNKVDALTRKHDIDYYNISNALHEGEITEEEAKTEARKSDNRLKDGARKYITNISDPDNMLAANLVLRGIQAKNLAEDLHIIDKLKYVKDPMKKMKKQMIKI